MENSEVVHNILVSVARELREGKAVQRDRIVATVMEQCFSGTSKEELKRWERVVRARLDHILSEEDADLPLIGFLSEVCDNCQDGRRRCAEVCPTGAISHFEGDVCELDESRCLECGHCIDACVSGAIVARSDFVRVALMLAEQDERPVYAILAPAFAGQFGEPDPTMIKGVFCELGFTDVYEVAMAADIISVQEAEEYIERVERGEPFMITSCCCPAFIKLVEKVRPKLVDMVSLSVSPMIALGRLLKRRESDCRVVFIGPCVAKKSEAKLPDLADAIDCVLTFRETRALFEAAGVTVEKAPAMEMADASHDGRIYAHTGGVTEAITRVIRMKRPNIEIRTVAGNGLKECNALLEQAEEGKFEATFMEGMGCPGGCVGGPGTIIPVEQGAENVNRFAFRAGVKEAARNHKAYTWLREYGSERDLFSRKLRASKNTGDEPGQ